MIKRCVSAAFLLLIATPWAHGQLSSAFMADSLYNRFNDGGFSQPQADLNDLKQLEDYLMGQGDICRQAMVTTWQADCYDKLGQPDSAVAINHRARALFNSDCDSLVFMSIQAKFSALYLSLGEFEQAILSADEALLHWNAKWPHDKTKSTLFSNKALAQVYSGDLESGSKTFRTLQRIARSAGNELGEMEAATNLGALFSFLHTNGRGEQWGDSSAVYNRQALAIAKKLNMTGPTIALYMNLANNESGKAAYYTALTYLDSAAALTAGGGFLQHAVNIEWSRSGIYTKLGRHREAVRHIQRFVSLKDSLLNVEKVKAVSELQAKYESERKERIIQELEVSKLNAELREEQLTKTRNIFFFSAFGVLLVATGLYWRLQYMRKSKSAIQKEKDISENLLLNILPEEVASELKAKGEAEARLIEQVTVLFTDFKGFTALSEKMSPKSLVHDLHECFSAFDLICGKHHIEKIKTIGDAYMAAGGLPTPNHTHASDVVKAALEMAAFVEDGKARKITAGLPYFEIRIGIHTGPVVAGIVGVKKFQYDIWGDTVNTASRMESSGAVGKVNISETTYSKLRDSPEFVFESRGNVEAKGKGKMGMYFVGLKS